MSKHNYSQYSNKNYKNNANDPNKRPNNRPAEPVANKPKETVEAPAEIKIVQETVETVTLPEMVKGTIAGCARLNVRAEPSITADIVCVLDATSEIEIDVNASNSEWFKIYTAIGIEGYCMRKFIDAYL